MDASVKLSVEVTAPPAARTDASFEAATLPHFDAEQAAAVQHIAERAADRTTAVTQGGLSHQLAQKILPDSSQPDYIREREFKKTISQTLDGTEKAVGSSETLSQQNVDRINRLHDLVFGDSSEFRVSRLNNVELREVFNAFRELGAAGDVVRMYEQASDENFKQSHQIRELTALGYNNLGLTAKGIEVLVDLVHEGWGTTAVYGPLGDALSANVRTADAVLRAQAEGIAIPSQLQMRYQNAFGQNAFATEVVPTALENKQQALTAAIVSYQQGFLDAPSAYTALGLYRSVGTQLRHLLEAKDAGETTSGYQSKAEPLADSIARAERLIAKLPLLVEHVLTKSGEPATPDYWWHASTIENGVALGRTLEELAPNIARAAQTAPGSWAMEKTANGIADAIAVRGLITGARAEGMPILDAFNDMRKDPSQRSALMQNTNPSPVDVLLSSTGSLRGVGDGYFSRVIPGVLGATGSGRVPDMVYNRSDAMKFRALSQEFGLHLLSDPRSVMAEITDINRQAFGTDALQDLHSAPHARLDAISDALPDALGLPEKGAARRGVSSATNASVALALGIGDCREHAIVAAGLFDAAQGLRAEPLFRSAYMHLDDGSDDAMQKFDRIVSKDLPEVLRFEVRIGSFDVLMPVEMEDVYRPVGHGTGEPLRERNYGMEQLEKHEPLSEYELRNSMLVATYDDGRIEKIRGTSKTPLPIDGGAPVVNSEGLVSVNLFNLVEKHTSTFLVARDPATKLVATVEHADTFYHGQTEGPYGFGSGNVIDSLLPNRLWRGSSREAISSDGHDAVMLPVVLEPSARSGRADQISRSVDNTTLSVYGHTLGDFDLVHELESPEARAGRDTLLGDLVTARK